VTWGRIAAGVGVLVLALVVVLAIRNGTGLPDIRQAVAAAGLWAPLLFVVLQSTLTVTPIPRSVFTVAAGVLFGSIGGLLLTITGTSIAAAVAYWLARLVGGRFVERHLHRPGVAWVRARLDRSGLLAMVSLRLIPAVPFCALNYAAALSGVRFSPYLLGTVLGVLPGTIGVVVLGDAAVDGIPHPAMLLVSLTSGAIGVTGAVIATRRGPAPKAAPTPRETAPGVESAA
jgi:uncharacterized membrane protein YdjX (TVP38/TMEM64 family)